MPLLLALDSSTSTGSAAVADSDGLRAEVVLRVGASASETLMPAVDRVMTMAGCTPQELDGLVIGGGPGSFTGLRIAAATAKGIAQALGIPIQAYSGLLAAAAGASAAGGEVCALFDARNRDVFVASYRFHPRAGGAGPAVEVVLQPSVLPIDELVTGFGDAALPLFTGDGALLHRARIEDAGGRVAPPHLAFPRASALLWLATVVPELGFVDDPVAWEPDYLRASGAERIAARRSAEVAAG